MVKATTGRAVNRRSSSSETSTKNRIKITARKLFAERGVEAVTVREIIAAAGAKNGGSLNYYFGSKDALIEELLAEIFREMSDAWLVGLSEIDKKGGPTSVSDIVSIIIDPPTPILVSDNSPTASRFLASVLSTRRQVVRDLMDRMHFSVFARLLTYIQELRRDIPPEIMRQRLIFFAWYAVSALGAYEGFQANGRRDSNIWTDYDPLQNIIDTGTGLIEADVSVPSNKKRSYADQKSKSVKRQSKSSSVVDEIFL